MENKTQQPHRKVTIYWQYKNMTSLLSNAIDNLGQGTHKIQCKYGHDNEQCETCRITFKGCDCYLKCTKGDLIEYKYSAITIT